MRIAEVILVHWSERRNTLLVQHKEETVLIVNTSQRKQDLGFMRKNDTLRFPQSQIFQGKREIKTVSNSIWIKSHQYFRACYSCRMNWSIFFISGPLNPVPFYEHNSNMILCPEIQKTSSVLFD